MNEALLGKWVQITLVNGKKWIGKLEEWDEDAIFISNGIDFGAQGHKGAECTNEEVSEVVESSEEDFQVS